MGDTTASGSVHVPWSDLSDRSAWILTNVEVPIVFERRRYRDLAASLGVRRDDIGQMRKELRAEVEGLSRID